MSTKMIATNRRYTKAQKAAYRERKRRRVLPHWLTVWIGDVEITKFINGLRLRHEELFGTKPHSSEEHTARLADKEARFRERYGKPDAAW